MLKIKRYLLGTFLCGLAACSKDNIQPPIDRTTQPRTMGVFIENNYDLSLLSTALKKTGLYDTLINNGPFTMFAPDNKAFGQLGIATTAQIDAMNTDSLREILKYHIIRNRNFTNMMPLQLDVKYPTLADKPLYVSMDITPVIFNPAERQIAVNGSLVGIGSKRDLALANGVIHIISKPFQLSDNTVQDFIAADTSLSLFQAAMQQFGMWNDLKSKPLLTVFVPNNEAFRKNDLTLEKIKAMKPAEYKPALFGIYTLNMRPLRIFSTDGVMVSKTNIYGSSVAVIDTVYGVSPNFQGFTEITSANVAVMKLDQNFWSTNPDGVSSANYYNGLAGSDHLCENGVVHVVTDMFLRPEPLKR
ncbi:fasciclin domain-containing protein [Chitinophaga sp. Cy-1792]|uniref:fasciclin domain-containing protein n=1 Tax=Chitinophaga sp. Cy-1792 TaxID=2608339 RepID=UPI0014221B1D|nr:fasciclin domain-containing protein [Chitinophaga sp. Cy-1792]